MHFSEHSKRSTNRINKCSLTSQPVNFDELVCFVLFFSTKSACEKIDHKFLHNNYFSLIFRKRIWWKVWRSLQIFWGVKDSVSVSGVTKCPSMTNNTPVQIQTHDIVFPFQSNYHWNVKNLKKTHLLGLRTSSSPSWHPWPELSFRGL